MSAATPAKTAPTSNRITAAVRTARRGIIGRRRGIIIRIPGSGGLRSLIRGSGRGFSRPGRVTTMIGNAFFPQTRYRLAERVFLEGNKSI